MPIAFPQQNLQIKIERDEMIPNSAFFYGKRGSLRDQRLVANNYISTQRAYTHYHNHAALTIVKPTLEEKACMNDTKNKQIPT